MQKYKKPKIDLDDLGVNPLTHQLEILINNLVFKNSYKYEDKVLVQVEKDVEYTPYTKMFISPERRKIISNLPPASKELYLWIMFEIPSGKDVFWLNKDRYMIENSTSINTYRKGLEYLVRYCIVQPTLHQDILWINPDFFFNGDRLKKYTKHLKPV